MRVRVPDALLFNVSILSGQQAAIVTYINESFKSKVVCHFIVNSVSCYGIVGNVLHVGVTELQSGV